MKNQIAIAIITMFGLASCIFAPVQLPTEYPSPTHFFTPPSPTLTPIPTNDSQANNETVLLDFALSQDETKVAIYTNQETFVYDLITHKKYVIKSFEKNISADYHSGGIAFSPDGTQIAVSDIFANEANESIEIWSLESLKLQATFSDIPKGYQVKKVEFTPNGKNILARISETSCEAAKEKFILFNINGESDWIKSDISSLMLNHYCNSYNYTSILLRFTNNDELFIFQIAPLNAPVLIYDANTGQYISEFQYANKEQRRVYYDVSPDGKTIVAEALDKSYLTSVDTGKEISIQGYIFLLNNENRFLVNNFHYLYLSENGKSKCVYNGIYYGPLIDRVRISAAKNIFASYNFEKHEFQVWKISNCELLYALPIEW